MNINPSTMNDKPIIIVDGLNFFIRHFSANPTMSSNGDPMGGFVGFLGGISALCEKFNPQICIVVWESGGSFKRKNILGTYKNSRRPIKLNRYYEDDIPNTKENHTYQISLLVEALKTLPVIQLYIKDCEADDVISYVTQYYYNQCNKIIVSSDKDFHQLINENVKQYSPVSKNLFDVNYVKTTYCVSPVNFAVARTYVGDKSDNIEGVEGVGFKTLSKYFPNLLNDEHMSYEQIIEESKTFVKQTKAIKNIKNSKQIVSRNWKLMNLTSISLSSDQIKKINDQIENIDYEINKMSLMRLMYKNGLQKIDINRQFSTIVNTLKLQKEK